MQYLLVIYLSIWVRALNAELNFKVVNKYLIYGSKARIQIFLFILNFIFITKFYVYMVIIIN
jgi:hypothetical protein